MYPKEELKQLQEMKQTKRQEFDRNDQNEKRLSKIKSLKHNYERSQEMFKTLINSGMTDSIEDVNRLILHLLDVGNKLSVESSLLGEQKSYFSAPNGEILIESNWKVLPDNTRYLSTIKLKPMTRRISDEN